MEYKTEIINLNFFMESELKQNEKEALEMLAVNFPFGSIKIKNLIAQKYSIEEVVHNWMKLSINVNGDIEHDIRNKLEKQIALYLGVKI